VSLERWQTDAISAVPRWIRAAPTVAFGLGWTRRVPDCPTTRGRLTKGPDAMTRVSLLSSPLLLGFEEIERLIERVGKSGGDSYPPYNIERIGGVPSSAAAPRSGRPELLRISLAVAGFTREQLDITIEDSQLVIRGSQAEDKSRDFLFRGIATRQFQRTFVLADGIEVRGADLSNGLLSIDLVRIEPERVVRRIPINQEQTDRDKIGHDQRDRSTGGGNSTTSSSVGPASTAPNGQNKKTKV
jgi:HSP20 family molecular chaperone IbpA